MLALMKHQQGSHTDVMGQGTLAPLGCCKSMLLGYLLWHKLQIYSTGK